MEMYLSIGLQSYILIIYLFSLLALGISPIRGHREDRVKTSSLTIGARSPPLRP